MNFELILININKSESIKYHPHVPSTINTQTPTKHTHKIKFVKVHKLIFVTMKQHLNQCKYKIALAS